MVKFGMEKQNRVRFWLKSADEAMEVMEWLFRGKKYADSLFYGQLVLEKTIKALFISRTDKSPPFVHDLVFYY